MMNHYPQLGLTDTTGNLSQSEQVAPLRVVRPFKQQLLKWIGNKQRFAHEIAGYLPSTIGTYIEPFLGSGAVLGTLAPRQALGADCFQPLIGIWLALKNDPDTLVAWYSVRVALCDSMGKAKAYEDILASYNANPNPADFVFLTRACYGGVVRFRRDGYMSTPCGVHEPISANSFADRVKIWHHRVKGAEFVSADYRETMARAVAGDVIYCDPPYSHTQTILYGAQDFSLTSLFSAIADAKNRGVIVALSIDGTKKSGSVLCDIPVPVDLFNREVAVNIGRSMLRRFQCEGASLENEVVQDRLLLTF